MTLEEVKKRTEFCTRVRLWLETEEWKNYSPSSGQCPFDIMYYTSDSLKDILGCSHVAHDFCRDVCCKFYGVGFEDECPYHNFDMGDLLYTIASVGKASPKEGYWR